MRTLTQKAALAFGVVFLLVGVLGLLTPGGTAMQPHLHEAAMLLGLFPVNVVHNLVHLAFGAWGIVASRGLDASRGYHRTGAVVYLLLVVLAFIDPTAFHHAPIGGHDIWLHALLAIGLGYFGFLHHETAVPNS